jgi:hypothetical protein
MKEAFSRNPSTNMITVAAGVQGRVLPGDGSTLVEKDDVCHAVPTDALAASIHRHTDEQELDSKMRRELRVVMRSPELRFFRT